MWFNRYLYGLLTTVGRKRGQLGVQFKSKAGKVDLAQMFIDQSTTREEGCKWQLRSIDIDYSYNFIKHDQEKLSMFDTAMGNIFLQIFVRERQ